MTIIATDGKTIAADGNGTANDGTIIGHSEKKIRRVGRTVYGFTGISTMLDTMVEWHEAGADPDKCPKSGDPNDQSWTLIVFRDGEVRQFTHTGMGRSEVVPSVWAWGVGRDFTIGCLLSGKSAREAVEMAIRHNTWLGGEITVLDVPEAASQPAQLAAAE